MNYQNWDKLTLVEQLANIGSEVERAMKWRTKKNNEYSRLAFYRGLELLDLTLTLSLSFPQFKELTRVRSALVDDFAGENTYHSTDESWQRYFGAFTWAARATT